MEQLAFATITKLQELIKNKDISKKELLSFFINRFERHDKDLGAALQIFSQQSITENITGHGLLDGIPGIIKDNICQKSRITSCGSKILENFTSPYDASAIARLKKSGAFLIGRANCDEFAMGSSTETSAFQLTKNPWDLSKVPGGSSGGTMAAIAAGLVPWGLGSETGGSVRQPAAFCGIVGLKPSYGLVSRYGLVAYASSLDQIGPATRTVYDNALVLSVIAGHDMKDSTSLSVPKKDYTKGLDGKLKEGLKIGIIDNALNAQGIDDEVKASIEQAIKQFESLGASVVRVSLPIMDYGAAIYFIISRAEAASNLARYDGVRYGLRAKDIKTLTQMYEDTRQEGFGQETKARIMIGNYVLSSGHAGEFYANAKKAQRLMRQEFSKIFKQVDVLIAPTTPTPAFSFGAFDQDKLQLDLQDYYTCSMNIIGIPAISVPCGFSKNNLPIGFQIIGPPLSEGLIYKTAYAYEQVTPWHTMHPAEFE